MSYSDSTERIVLVDPTPAQVVGRSKELAKEVNGRRRTRLVTGVSLETAAEIVSGATSAWCDHGGAVSNGYAYPAETSRIGVARLKYRGHVLVLLAGDCINAKRAYGRLASIFNFEHKTETYFRGLDLDSLINTHETSAVTERALVKA